MAGTAGLPPTEVVLAEGEYMVYPSALRWTGHGDWERLAAGAMRELSVVREPEILGKVWFRLRPWSRMGKPGSEQP